MHIQSVCISFDVSICFSKIVASYKNYSYRENGSKVTCVVFVLQWEGDQLVREIFPEAIIFRPADIYGIKDWYFFKYIYHRKYNKGFSQ